MQRLLLTIICCIQALMLSAVPAKRDRYKLQLADGSYITATMMGDEMLHFFRTDDGRFLQCDTRRQEADADKRQGANAKPQKGNKRRTKL